METDTCGTNPSGSNVIGRQAPAPSVLRSHPHRPLEFWKLRHSPSRSPEMIRSHSPDRSFGRDPAIRSGECRESRTDVVFPFAFGSTTPNLTCPANPPAKISSSPDGNGNVVVGNFLTLAVGSTPIEYGAVWSWVAGGKRLHGWVTDSSGNTTQQDLLHSNVSGRRRWLRRGWRWTADELRERLCLWNR